MGRSSLQARATRYMEVHPVRSIAMLEPAPKESDPYQRPREQGQEPVVNSKDPTRKNMRSKSFLISGESANEDAEKGLQWNTSSNGRTGGQPMMCVTWSSAPLTSYLVRHTFRDPSAMSKNYSVADTWSFRGKSPHTKARPVRQQD